MTREGWIKAGALAILAVPFVAFVLASWRFRFEPTWRMDPIPFGFFVASAYFLGRFGGSRPPPKP